MCGIVGILGSFNQASEQEERLRGMVSTLDHRGPDGWGMYLAPEMALGHTRLSIVDLCGGDQPMATQRCVISFNGEIYNHIELREKLLGLGVSFSTTSDTEVVLRAYEHYGPRALAEFNGQFAILIWDKLEKRLFIARDRFGIRPLYMMDFQGATWFSSEVKAFETIPGFNRELSLPDLLEHGQLWNSLGERTVFSGISALPAGTYEIFDAPGSSIRSRYYEIGDSYQTPPATFDEAREQFEELLEDSVRLRLRADVPVGCYLSGGIDSAVTTHLASKHCANQFKSFSIAFADKDFDESSFQREMAAQVDSEHIELQITGDQIRDNFVAAADHFEKPVFRTAPLPLFLLSQEVRKNGIKVVLTGEGADEILFGYDSFKELKLLRFWDHNRSSAWRPALLKKLYPHLKHFSDPRQFGLLKLFYEGFLDSYDNDLASLNIRANNNKVLKNYFHPDHALNWNEDSLLGRVKKILPPAFSSWSLLQKNQFLEMRTLLQGYLLSSQGDRMSLAHGVEGRYPFLDHRLVDLVFHFPDKFKLCGFSQKHLLRKAAKGWIPDSILDRPKLPYQAPDLKSFFHEGRPTGIIEQYMSAEAISRTGIFKPGFVARFLKKFSQGIPERIGYRDNMLITFILSTQIAASRPAQRQVNELDPTKQRVDIRELTGGKSIGV